MFLDHYAASEHPVDQQQNVPELLKAILSRNPNVFGGSSKSSSVPNAIPPVAGNSTSQQQVAWNQQQQLKQQQQQLHQQQSQALHQTPQKSLAQVYNTDLLFFVICFRLYSIKDPHNKR